MMTEATPTMVEAEAPAPQETQEADTPQAEVTPGT